MENPTLNIGNSGLFFKFFFFIVVEYTLCHVLGPGANEQCHGAMQCQEWNPWSTSCEVCFSPPEPHPKLSPSILKTHIVPHWISLLSVHVYILLMGCWLPTVISDLALLWVVTVLCPRVSLSYSATFSQWNMFSQWSMKKFLLSVYVAFIEDRIGNVHPTPKLCQSWNSSVF